MRSGTYPVNSSSTHHITSAVSPQKANDRLSPSPSRFEQKSEIRDSNNLISGSRTVSFGTFGSQNRGGRTVHLPNGDYYEGELDRDGEYHGYGTYLFANKNLEYVGEFEHGHMTGKGRLFKIIHFVNGSLPVDQIRNSRHQSKEHRHETSSIMGQRIIIYEG